MKTEDIVEMIEKAGLCEPRGVIDNFIQLERFANLVAAAEREACANVCEEQMQGKSIWIEGARACSLAIRARGQA